MRVEVDRIKCSGIGLCELAAPTIFEVGEDGQTHLLREPSDDDLPAVREAVANCPASALSLRPNE